MSAPIQQDHVLPWLRAAVLAGRQLTMTVRSLRSGQHLTYRLRPVKRIPADKGIGPLVYVDVLTGPNNATDYTFLGAVYFRRDGRYDVLTGARTQRPDGSHGSPIDREAPSAKTLDWLFGRFSHGMTPAPVAEVWHDGTCALCGRPLTTPESVALGIGPICIERVGGG